MKRVLILGNPGDEHARHVSENLTRVGVRTDYFDIRDFPVSVQLSLNPIDDEIRIGLPSGSLLLSEVTSIYWRNYNPVPNLYRSAIADPAHAHICENDSRSAAESFLLSQQVRWVNGWQGFQLHQRKPFALRQIAALGVRCPQTLISNDIDALQHFLNRVGPCIYKPVQGGSHTRRVERMDFNDEVRASLQASPITFQEEIRGTNVRVFVAGDAIFGIEIATDCIDFRDDHSPVIRTIDLPPHVRKDSQKIARELGLLWTGIDFRLSEEGEFVFLEANPSPMFIGFERASGIPLTQALIDLLAG